MDAKQMTRAYFDSLFVEQRLMDSTIPNTNFTLWGKHFKTPIMTAALSHIGTFNPDMPDGMVEYAKGAKLSEALHWIGMGSDDEFKRVITTGAKTIRIIKPYADEDRIFEQIKCAEENGALAVGMDIDHMFDLKGYADICMGDTMSVKSSNDLKTYINSTKLPFIIKGILSVKDAKHCVDIGAKGIVVSHHGGRLNVAVPPLYILPQIANVVGKDIPIFVDCGICSGADAYKAMALGATAISVGTHLIPYIRKGGASAVSERINSMTDELRAVMAYTGVKDINNFDSDIIHKL